MTKEMKMMGYTIGLDIGTTSVGWAVTNGDAKLCRYHGQNMWGSRLFDEAQTAVNRRVFRSTRRRMVRRRQRIELLQEMLCPMIAEVDDGFFIKLNQSFLQENDENRTYKERFDDFMQEYDYKSIFHLRKALMESDKKMDARLVYLAIHHIIKYRGNFLYERDDISANNIPIIELLNKLGEDIRAKFDYDLCDADAVNFIRDVLAMDITKTEKVKLLKMKYKDNISVNFFEQIFKLLCGCKVDLSKLLDDENITAKDGKKLTIDFSDDKIDDELPEILEILGENACLIEETKKVYDANILVNILGNFTSISDAMIERYNKHGYDLSLLKKVIKRLAPNKYNELFKIETEQESYSTYSVNTKYCSNETLCKKIKKILDPFKDDIDVKQIFIKIDKQEFLQKLNIKANGVIPYQLNKSELVKIIMSQSKYYKCLAENKDKIISLLTFRVPYYVGPLNYADGKFFAWVQKKQGMENERILPWNFDEIVDRDACADMFIKRMLNKCTYLNSETVLPQKSILYSRFETLNELRNIKFDDEPISLDLRNVILNKLFTKKKKITEKVLREFLKSINYHVDEIKGFAKEHEFMSSLSSYIDFCKIFGSVDESNLEMIEDIILSMTTLQTSDILASRLKKRYPIITDSQIMAIVAKQNLYTGWGRLSKLFLSGITAIVDDRPMTIIECMEQKGKNLNEVLSNKFGYNEVIKALNQQETQEVGIDDITNLQTSPSNKRAIWQTLKVVDEIVKIMGGSPTNISIEFAKGEDKIKKRTKSRYDYLSEIYASLKDDVQFYNSELYKELQELKDSDKLDNEAYFLYFLQNGKCLYSGKQLDINSLKFYEVDHILPRCIIKDDSIDNKALVLKAKNQEKGDALTLSKDVINNCKNLWFRLNRQGVLSDKKLKNLLRENFSSEDIEYFIARQLVQTRQIIKNVATILNKKLNNTNIISFNASLLSDLKLKYGIYKVRELNDLHHAVDAYTACFLCDFIDKRYPKMLDIFNNNTYKFGFNKRSLVKNGKYGFILNSLDYSGVELESGYVYNADERIALLLKTVQRNDALVTKRTFKPKGALFNQTLYPSNKNAKGFEKGVGAINIKDNLNVADYGGYNDLKKSEIALIEHTKRGDKVRSLVGIPLLLVAKNKGDKFESKFAEYLNSKGYINAVVLKYLAINQKIRFCGGTFSGSEVYIAAEKYLHNAKQITLNWTWTKYLYDLFNTPKSDIDRIATLGDKAIEFVKMFLAKMQKEIPLLAYVPKRIIESGVLDVFGAFEFDKKQLFIRRLIQITICNSAQVKFKDNEFGSVKMSGLGIISPKSVLDDFVLIDESITGLNRREYRL